MVTAPADRRPVLIAAALFAVALTLVAVRTIDAGMAVEARPLPAADIQAVSAYLAPLPDTSRLASGAPNGIVVARDPFVSVGVAPAQALPRATVNTSLPKTASTQPWVVSTILVEGSRKSAIVNNTWVTIGDSLAGGSRLTEVEPDHIVVTDAKGVRHKVSIQGGESW
jgi:hypothetical protein